MFITVITSLFLSICWAQTPKWAQQDTVKLKDKLLTMVCSGNGSTADLARYQAVKSCTHSSAQFLETNTVVKSFSIETDKNLSFHQEVISENNVKGLLCIPVRDQIQQENSVFTAWIECQFNLDLVKSENNLKEKSSIGIYNLAQKSEIKNSRFPKRIFLYTVPKCSEVIITGIYKRVLPCTNNPLEINIQESETEMVVRATNRVTKTVNLTERQYDETVQVLLNR